MNHVLDMLEELMVKVEQHEITYIIFSVIALLYLGAILDLIFCVHITCHDLRAAEERLTDGHNKLAVRLQELEQAQKKLRRTAINNFRLTRNVGVQAGVLPENAVKEALEGWKNNTSFFPVNQVTHCGKGYVYMAEKEK